MKFIIVTGDSRGLGQVIAERILQSTNYGVIGISRKSTQQTDELIRTHKDRYLHIKYNLDNIEGIQELYSKDLKNIGELYGLVNNAAIAYDDIITNARTKEIEKMFRVNVLSPILLTKYVIRDMLLKEISGSIVHISSVSTQKGYKGLSMYAATKGALESFSKNIAREWGVKGIRSNCVSPGFMETDMSGSLNVEQKNRIYSRTALKKPTSISSVSESVIFLLSDKASSITGEIININSGTS